MFDNQMDKKYSNFKKLIKKLTSYIDGSYVDNFYDNYSDIYAHTIDMVVKNDKNINQIFKKNIIMQKTMEYNEINHVFDAIKDINSNVKISVGL